MASSPVYWATPDLPRPRSSFSVPAPSHANDRSGTPGSSQGRLSFYNRSITPSLKSRPSSVAPDDPTDRVTHTKRLASRGRLLQSWSEVTERYKNIGLEDDEEIDLHSETVHRSDGSVARWRPDHRSRRASGSDSETEEEEPSEGDSIQAGPSRRKPSKPPVEESDSSSDTSSADDGDDDDDDGDSDNTESEEEEDEMGSWAVQEESFKAELADKKAALLLSSLRAAPRKTKEEDMADFLRDEEVQRIRRMSARVEGRDSRCHTDALSDSDISQDENLREDRRSPSRFSTMITDAEDDLFSDSESGEDELAAASSDYDLGTKVSSSEESESEDMDEAEAELSRQAIERARRLNTSWLTEATPPHVPLRISLSPDSSPEPVIVAEKLPSPSRVIPLVTHRSLAAKRMSDAKSTAEVPKPIDRRAAVKAKVLGITLADPTPDKKLAKGKARMSGERPAESIMEDNVFGPADTIDVDSLDRQSYRRSRYRQKASQSFKTCRYCRIATPSRRRLSEYCRGANHSKHCTFEFPPESNVRNEATQPTAAPSTTQNKYWKESLPRPIGNTLPTMSATETPKITPTKSTKKRSGRTSGGLEKWRYYENLVKKPDKQTDRSCPYCRLSDDRRRAENAVYCRGRIESKDCTFDGHKGSLRASSKTRPSKSTPREPAKVDSTAHQVNLPGIPLPAVTEPDLTVDETKLDLKLYYASLIQDQSQSGYRFCPDCARSEEVHKRRLSFWCRGRISYKSCGYWNGDESGHRQRRRQSAPGSGTATSRTDQPTVASPLPQVATNVLPRQVREEDVDPAPLPPSTAAANDNTKYARSVTSVATLYYPEVHTLKHGGTMHCKACRSAGGKRKKMSAYCRGRTSSSRCQFTLIVDAAGKTATNVESVKRKRGRPRKSLDTPPAVPVAPIEINHAIPVFKPKNMETSSDETRPQTDPIKRKPGRPRKTPILGIHKGVHPASEPVKRKPGRPKSLPAPAASLATRHEDGEPPKIASDPMKKKAGRPKSQPPSQTEEELVDFTSALEEARTAIVKPKPLWAPSGARDSPQPNSRRRARSHTFDIVVPASRSATPVSSPTLDIAVGRDRPGLAMLVSSMRNNHTTHQIAPLDFSIGTKRDLDELPPSSPPASLSPSPSPRPIRNLPYRSSPLASVPPRSSTARSETPSMPLKGILRQSSEMSDAPRSNKRARFSLMRSPSAIDESYGMDFDADSDSSDDELLLVPPSSASRRSCPPSSRRHASSSPFAPESRYAESPQPGRLSSSMLAAYAPTLDRLPTLGSASIYTPPFVSRHALSSPPVNTTSSPLSRGMMLPPPVPASKGLPRSEPRPREVIRRAHTVGPAQRPRSSTFSSHSGVMQAPQDAVAQNIVIRRLIDDVR